VGIGPDDSVVQVEVGFVTRWAWEGIRRSSTGQPQGNQDLDVMLRERTKILLPQEQIHVFW